LKQLWVQIRKEKKVKLFFVFILIIFCSFAEVISIGSIIPFLGALSSPETVYNNALAKPILNFIGIYNPDEILIPFTILFCICILISAFLRFSLLSIQSTLSFSIGNDISISIYEKTLFQPYPVHVSRNSSEVIATISNKVNSVISNILFSSLTLIGSLLMTIIIALALISINPYVVFSALLAFGIMYYLVVLFSKKRIETYSKTINSQTVHLVKALQEGLGGIRDVLINGTQKTYCKIYQNADLPLRNAQAQVEIISGGPRFLLEAFGMVFISLLALSLTSLTSNLNTVIPVLGAMALGAQRLLPVLQMAYARWTAMNAAKETLRDTLELLIQKIPENSFDQSIEKLPFNKKLKLNDVSFRYNPNSSIILNKINFEIKKGDRVGFVGATGSGKSTILDIIMGLLNPTDGHMSVDDKVISQKNIRNWQARIAHVPQSIYLSDSSIANNIAFGITTDKIDMERVRQSAKKAQISDAIESFDKKYETFVGERGARLSGGQRQRIGIARALYKNADVIVFDEATSALDSKTEEDVMNSIYNLSDDLTIIIVAHRVSTLKNCTKIIDLNNGKDILEKKYSEVSKI
jgi:ATP-binding cassette subfamily B protein